MDFTGKFVVDTFKLAGSHPFITCASAAGISALVIAYRDYRAYIAMGPHGLPDDFYGWRRQLQMTSISRKDVTAVAPYDERVVAKSFAPYGNTSFFTKPLGKRGGDRPKIPGFVAPQRQVNQTATETRKKEMFAYLKTRVESNKSILQSDLSRLEGPVPAVQLREGIDVPSFLKPTRGEIIHVHPPDGSTHLVLSLADSADVIATGWGQRHRLSGGFLPWTYTLIYAPRTEEEFEIWKIVVDAAAKFCCKHAGNIAGPTS